MTNLSATIDELGAVKAALAELKKKEDALKEALGELEAGAYEGDLFRLNVMSTCVERTDWKAIAMGMSPSPQRIAAHTVYTDQRTLRVGARTGKKVAA